MVMVTVIVAIYYNVIIAYSLYYMFASFQSPLPWTGCSSWADSNCTQVSTGVVRFTAFLWKHLEHQTNPLLFSDCPSDLQCKRRNSDQLDSGESHLSTIWPCYVAEPERAVLGVRHTRTHARAQSYTAGFIPACLACFLSVTLLSRGPAV